MMQHEKYAAVTWCVEDIHEYRKGEELPRWSDEQCDDFLLDHENHISDAMVEKGWQAIGFAMEFDEHSMTL